MPRACFLCTLAAALVWAAPILGEDGVRIEPQDDGNFEYVDDFSTPRFLLDAFTSNFGAADWKAGKLLHRGPINCQCLARHSINELVCPVGQRSVSPFVVR